MPCLKHRADIIEGLVSGVTAFNGDTLDSKGRSYRGRPGYAVSLPWWRTETQYPHRRLIGEWFDSLAGRPFDKALEAQTTADWLSGLNAGWVPESSAALLGTCPRAYGAWREGASRLELSISAVVPHIETAIMCGAVLQERAIYWLEGKEEIWVEAEIVRRGLSFLRASRSLTHAHPHRGANRGESRKG